MSDDPIMAALARLEAGQSRTDTRLEGIESRIGRFETDVSAALGTVNTVLGEIIDGMATKAQLDARLDAITEQLAGTATMARMNAGFERGLDATHALRRDSDTQHEIILTLIQRVTRLEQDVRQLRGGGA